MGILGTVRELLDSNKGKAAVKKVVENCSAFLELVEGVKKFRIQKYRNQGETYWVNSSDFFSGVQNVRIFERVRGVNVRELIIGPEGKKPEILRSKESVRKENREMFIHGQLHALMSNNADKKNDPAIRNIQPATPFNGTRIGAKRWSRVAFQQPFPISASESPELSFNGIQTLLPEPSGGPMG
jgi:hypothetical protein